MAFCVNCKYNYPDGLDLCPDCEEQLVEELPGGHAAAFAPDDSWVVVGSLKDETKTDAAKGSLDSSNIPSVFLSSPNVEDARNTSFLIAHQVSEIHTQFIMVPREFREEALMLLDHLLGEEMNDAKNYESNY